MTTDRSVAEQFLRKMHAGHPEYGCFVSTNKTLISFDLSLDGVQAVKRVQAKEGFPWCGYLLHQKLLEVRYDYSRFSSNRECLQRRMRCGAPADLRDRHGARSRQ
jgi:telomerase reverse transcriptase